MNKIVKLIKTAIIYFNDENSRINKLIYCNANKYYFWLTLLYKYV